MSPLASPQRFASALLASVSSLALLSMSNVASAQEITPVPPVTVTAPALEAAGPNANHTATPTMGDSSPAVAPAGTPAQVLQQDGKENQGYRANLVSNAGLFDQSKIQDLPYAFAVAPSDLLVNLGGPSAEKALSFMPDVQLNYGDARGYGVSYQSRGFTMETSFDNMGVGEGSIGPIPIEDKERVEQLSGLSGFLNGTTLNRIGGVVNYVLKRPTSAPLYSITVGDAYGASGYVHSDFSGPIGERLGYRLNIVGQDGDTAISGQSAKRGLISAAIDFRPTDNTLIQLDASHLSQKTNEILPWWTPTGLIPAPINMSNTSPLPFTYEDWTNNQAGVRARTDINEHVTVRGGFEYSIKVANGFVANQQPISNTGAYSILLSKGINTEYANYDAYGYADFKFDTFGIKHTVTAGWSWQTYNLYNPSTNAALATNATVTGFNLFNPFTSAIANTNTQLRAAYLNMIVPPTDNIGAIDKYESLQIADRIDVNEKISLILGMNYTHLAVLAYNNTVNQVNLGTVNTKNTDEAVTPSGALVIKPIPQVTLYGTFQQALENGGVAASTYAGVPVTNPGGSGFAIDSQYEIGAKATIGGALATVALFDITRASDLYMPNAGGASYTYVNNGRENHKGVEFGLSGKVMPQLSLYGGATIMDAKLTSEPSTPAYVGQMPTNVSDYMAKLYAEYEVAQVPGLVFGAGIQYYSRQAVANVTAGQQQFVPDYAVGNLGVRYSTKIMEKATTFRVTVDNFTNTKYWVSPSNPGLPITVAASMTVHF